MWLDIYLNGFYWEGTSLAVSAEVAESELQMLDNTSQHLSQLNVKRSNFSFNNERQGAKKNWTWITQRDTNNKELFLTYRRETFVLVYVTFLYHWSFYMYLCRLDIGKREKYQDLLLLIYSLKKNKKEECKIDMSVCLSLLKCDFRTYCKEYDSNKHCIHTSSCISKFVNSWIG